MLCMQILNLPHVFSTLISVLQNGHQHFCQINFGILQQKTAKRKRKSVSFCIPQTKSSLALDFLDWIMVLNTFLYNISLYNFKSIFSSKYEVLRA